uniref:Uncharacterized protein n=1 Tax=Arundo donax TaxID=35708 RepID=A0A0A9GZU7_ARUDO
MMPNGEAERFKPDLLLLVKQFSTIGCPLSINMVFYSSCSHVLLCACMECSY